MMKLLSAASVLAIAAGSQAAPFVGLSYEAGGGLPGIAGQGFTTSGKGFYNRLGATNTSLASGDPFLWSNNDQAADSYFALTGFGPSRLMSADGGADAVSAALEAHGYNDSYDANPGANGVFGPGSHIGLTGDADGQAPGTGVGTVENAARAGVAVVPNTPSGPAYGKPGQDGVFLGQFTVNDGAVLSGGVFFSVLISQGVYEGQNLVLGGPSVVIAGQPYALKAYKIVDLTNLGHSRSGGNLGTGSGSSQRFGDADVYHIWIETQEIPTPGTLALAGLGGLVAFRRRRA